MSPEGVARSLRWRNSKARRRECMKDSPMAVWGMLRELGRREEGVMISADEPRQEGCSEGRRALRAAQAVGAARLAPPRSPP